MILSLTMEGLLVGCVDCFSVERLTQGMCSDPIWVDGGWWWMPTSDPPVLILGQSFSSFILAITTVGCRMNWCQPPIFLPFHYDQLLLEMKGFPRGPEFTYCFLVMFKRSGFFCSFPFCYGEYFILDLQYPISWNFTELMWKNCSVLLLLQFSYMFWSIST